MNLNGKQVMSIIMAVLGVLMVAKSQLVPMFGPEAAEYVVNAAGLLNLMLGSVMAAISGNVSQTAQVQSVLNMPGVEKIDVNRNASPELAKLAVDPDIDKIAPTPESQIAVSRTAEKVA